MVKRPLADHNQGLLSGGICRHIGEAQGTAHLCGQLVLPRLHPDRGYDAVSDKDSVMLDAIRRLFFKR